MLEIAYFMICNRTYSFFSGLKKKFLIVRIEGINRGVSFLYCAYSLFSAYFFSFAASRRGMPLTFNRRKVTKTGEIRETMASGKVSAGAHRPYKPHQVIISPRSEMVNRREIKVREEMVNRREIKAREKED